MQKVDKKTSYNRLCIGLALFLVLHCQSLKDWLEENSYCMVYMLLYVCMKMLYYGGYFLVLEYKILEISPSAC